MRNLLIFLYCLFITIALTSASYCKGNDVESCINENPCVWCGKELNKSKCIIVNPCSERINVTLENKCQYGYIYKDLKCRENNLFIMIGFLVLMAIIVLAVYCIFETQCLHVILTKRCCCLTSNRRKNYQTL